MNATVALHVVDGEAGRLARIRLQATCSREEGAALVGVPVSTFDDWRGKGIVPQPIPGTKRWSVERLLSSLGHAPEADVNAAPSPLEQWKRSRG